MNYAPANNGQQKKFLVHTARRQRFREIATGFCAGHTVEYFDNVGLLFWGGAPSRQVLQQALESSRSNSAKGLKLALKRWVLKSQYRWSHRFLKQRKPEYLLVWNGIKGHRALLVEAAKELGIGVFYFEEAPLPGKLAIDTRGVNYGSSLPHQIEFYENWCEENTVDDTEWRAMGRALKSREATHNASVGQNDACAELRKENYVFFPLQVEGDSQITVYGDWVRSVRHSVEEIYRASAYLPAGWHVRVKEHPSSRQSMTNDLMAMQNEKFRIDNSTDTVQQLQASRGVITINSSVGLQGFFYDKPVAIMGNAMFGLTGLVEKIKDPDDLRNYFQDPEKWSFSLGNRNVFMAYLCAAQFPDEDLVRRGQIRAQDILHRDAKKRN